MLVFGCQERGLGAIRPQVVPPMEDTVLGRGLIGANVSEYFIPVLQTKKPCARPGSCSIAS